MKPPPPSRSAYTLVELVLVLIIIGIMAGMAVPRYAMATARYRASAAANRIAADLAMAQQNARATSLTQPIVFTAASGTYVISNLTSLDNGSTSYSVNLTKS